MTPKPYVDPAPSARIVSVRSLYFLCALAMVSESSTAGGQAGVPPAPTVVAARADSVVRAFMADKGPASVSVIITRGADTLVHAAWGQADIGTGRAATIASTYRIGSMSKQFTAALILRMIDRGRLTLADTIGGYLTGLRPEWRRITIEQLLNHTSGLQPEYRQPQRRLEALPVDTLIRMATRDTMLFAPGTAFSYSNTGYMLLGALVEKLYRKPYGMAVRDEIARPLGLGSLSWCNDPEKVKTEVKGYARTGGGDLEPAVEVNPALALGAGGLCAAPHDIALWNRALHTGKVLSAASYAAMVTPRGAAAASGYGFGLRVQRQASGQLMIHHDGATPGFVAENAWYAPESLSVSVFYTIAPAPVGGGIAPALGRIALGLPDLPRLKAAVVADDPRLPEYVGEYELAPGRTLTVTLEDGALFVQPTGNSRQPLMRTGNGTFSVGASGNISLAFVAGPDGRIASVTMRANGNERVLRKTRTP